MKREIYVKMSGNYAFVGIEGFTLTPVNTRYLIELLPGRREENVLYCCLAIMKSLPIIFFIYLNLLITNNQKYVRFDSIWPTTETVPPYLSRCNYGIWCLINTLLQTTVTIAVRALEHQP